MPVPTAPPAAPLGTPEPAPPAVTVEARDVACRNCDAPLTGEYCARCGQRAGPVDPTLADLASDAWESITNVDGTLVATLRALFAHPGRLTVEFIAGRRARYLTPIRIYLLCSLAFFAVNAIDLDPWRDGSRTPEQVALAAARAAEADSIARARIAAGESRDVLGGTNTEFSRRLQRGSTRLEADGDSLGSMVSGNIPSAMFVFMPLYAALLQLLYRSRRRRYPSHLVFALHAHAFFFAVMAGAEAVEAIVTMTGTPRQLEGTADAIVLTWLAVYFVIALRRVYGGRWRGAIARALVLANVYPMIIATVLALGVGAYLWILGA
jgi:hypothetical protein